LVAACIVVPQIVVAAFSPSVGRWAQRWVRRPILLIGFAALPIRGLLFMVVADPRMLVAVQLLDGVCAAVFGVLVPLTIADITRGTGRFNLAQGIVGSGIGIGASLSTTLAGWMSDRLGSSVAFLRTCSYLLAKPRHSGAFFRAGRSCRRPTDPHMSPTIFSENSSTSEHGARSTFIFAASLARSRPRSQRQSSRRALPAARRVLEFLSTSFSRTIAPLDDLISIPKHKSTNSCPKNAGRCPKNASQTALQLCSVSNKRSGSVVRSSFRRGRACARSKAP
jgi:MFS family permease